MNIDREKAKRFLDMMNEAQVKLEIEHNSYPESEELERAPKQQPGYMKLEWQWYGMDRQQMLKREKELGL